MVLAKLGRYQLRRVLGRGAMGVVYEGFDPTLNRRVAVKTILKSVALDAETSAEYSARFVREAQAVARLNHPHILQVHDFGEHEEVAYLVMEYIEGRELHSYFEAHEPFTITEVVRIMGELLDALDFAHRHGVVHRDIKPANVMLDAQRRVKLADFGVARILDSDRSMVGTMVGTPAFMSPEQIRGEKIDGRTDIFSAGTILYQLLTGEQPFKGEGAWTVVKKIIEEEPPSPSSLVLSVAPAFDNVVKKALAKAPGQRYARAQEFAAALRDALQLEVPPAATTGSGTTVKGGDAEVEFWRSIQNSTDPAEFEIYLDEFPQGTYAQLARVKLAKLRQPVQPAGHATQAPANQTSAGSAGRAGGGSTGPDPDATQQYRVRAPTQGPAARTAPLDSDVLAGAETPESVSAASHGVPDPARRKALPWPGILVAIVIVAIGIGVYGLSGRTPAPVPPPAPEAKAPTPPVAAPSAPAPAVTEKPGVTAAELERIKSETEERVRREYAEKAAIEKSLAEKAAAEKAAAEKAALEKSLAANAAALKKAAAEKEAADKLAAQKALSEAVAAGTAAAARAAAEKAAALAAAEKAMESKRAAEKAAAEKIALDKSAAEKATAAKAASAAAAKPGWPNPGDRWVYEARDPDKPDRKIDLSVEIVAVTPTSIRDEWKIGRGAGATLTHRAGVHLIGLTEGITSFTPYLRAFQEIRAGERWTNVDFSQLWRCSTGIACSANATVIGKEKVKVRGGTYDTWKIVVEFRVENNSGTGEFTFWYSEEARRTVKYRARSEFRPSHSSFLWTQPFMDMELVSYTPAEKK